MHATYYIETDTLESYLRDTIIHLNPEIKEQPERDDEIDLDSQSTGTFTAADIPNLEKAESHEK